MEHYSPADNLLPLLDSIEMKYAYKGPWGEEDVKAMRSDLDRLLGDKPERRDPEWRTVSVSDRGSYLEKEIVFSSEENAEVPCYLLVPKALEGKAPVMICLQGHTSGMHISLGRPLYPGDERWTDEGSRSFGLQAVSRGYIALVLEQRSMGMRKDTRPEEVREDKRPCHFAAMVSLLIGRTLIGERVWDISRALDVLETMDEVDPSRIYIMGTSGGGTASFFASCMEERIAGLICSCAFCSMKQSIGRIDHCDCNYIPGIMKYFDMGELSALIAPRPIVIVAGREDHIFPYEGVLSAYSVLERIYKDKGAGDRCRLVTGPAGHKFYPELAWPEFTSLLQEAMLRP